MYDEESQSRNKFKIFPKQIIFFFEQLRESNSESEFA